MSILGMLRKIAFGGLGALLLASPFVVASFAAAQTTSTPADPCAVFTQTELDAYAKAHPLTLPSVPPKLNVGMPEGPLPAASSTLMSDLINNKNAPSGPQASGASVPPPVTSVITAAQVKAQLLQMCASRKQIQSATGASSPSLSASSGSVSAPANACAAFATTLRVGSRGTEVTRVQKFLNRDPSTKLASSGIGSSGNESAYFGPLMKAAVIKFQEKYAADILVPNGLTAGNGLWGVSTRAKATTLLQANCSN